MALPQLYLHSIERIIFLTPRAINAIEAAKWSFSYLREQGFAIEVIDLAELLHKGRDIKGLVENPLQGDFIHHVSSYTEFEALINKFSGNSFFIDYLVGHSNVSLNEERIFRILKKYNAQYAILSSGALPVSTTSSNGMRGQLKKLKGRLLKAVLDPRALLNYLVTRLICTLTAYRLVYPLPSIIFGGNSETLSQFLAARKLEKEKVVLINSYDFDTANLYLRSLGNKLPVAQEICVFLDEAATHHSDFALLDIEPADPLVYFDSMNHFFDFIEKYTGLKVVIAAHPRSRYDLLGNVFRGRAVIKGTTVDLVAKSKLVVMHMSTSLSYAVLFEKPVIPVKIPGMESSEQMNKMVDVISAEIGTTPLDIDRDELTPSLFDRQCDLVKYANYRDRYVKTVGAGESLEWEIVANKLKRTRS